MQYKIVCVLIEYLEEEIKGNGSTSPNSGYRRVLEDTIKSLKELKRFW